MFTGKPAGALADAWTMVETCGGIPHVYEVGNDGEGLGAMLETCG